MRSIWNLLNEDHHPHDVLGWFLRCLLPADQRQALLAPDIGSTGLLSGVKVIYLFCLLTARFRPPWRSWPPAFVHARRLSAI
jgi:hypothetical protein